MQTSDWMQNAARLRMKTVSHLIRDNKSLPRRQAQERLRGRLRQQAI